MIRLSDGVKEEKSRGRRGDWGQSPAPVSPGSLFIAASFFFLSTI